MKEHHTHPVQSRLIVSVCMLMSWFACRNANINTQEENNGIKSRILAMRTILCLSEMYRLLLVASLLWRIFYLHAEKKSKYP